ncbi:purine nucleoside phosphoramidase [Buchnera aphidicola (Schlechtendalia chinensis)]|uniref:Purine nucleoside phosphoramidase n=1 Tax=Buchnera aphidicola subsp. Schlechtendalia chinensis TaxID=118110 RepID=A0A172WDR6_BUCSC|nr:histidine triad nucleotide-binding protein [Buchnera aphidicola]ANF17101.1 purine nucleoside phosphoramidase [Buchnera aphidicola (Schlechtendalia chinensis)]
MKNQSIFSKIIKENDLSKIIYQDKDVTAFNDINPIAPVHIIIVSNELIRSTNEINEKNKHILGHMMYIATVLAKKKKISENGYRLIINCNSHAGQEIFHLHLHLLGGKKLGKMLF